MTEPWESSIRLEQTQEAKIAALWGQSDSDPSKRASRRDVVVASAACFDVRTLLKPI